MKTSQADIVVTSPDGEYLMVVEVKSKPNESYVQKTIQQLKSYMLFIGCSVGLLVTRERIIVLRDSFKSADEDSINIVGEAHLPSSLFPPISQRSPQESGFEFESQVQQWLEKLKITPNLDFLPEDLKNLLNESIINLLQLGEVRAAHPRWS